MAGNPPQTMKFNYSRRLDVSLARLGLVPRHGDAGPLLLIKVVCIFQSGSIQIVLNLGILYSFTVEMILIVVIEI